MPKTHLKAGKAGNVLTLPATGDRRTDYRDESLPGFMLRVSPNGKRSYAVRYDAPNRVKRTRRYKALGDARIVSLGAARKAAHKILEAVEEGRDPVAEERAAPKPEPMTVGEFLDEYLERHAKLEKRSWREDERRIKRIKTALGDIQLADLTTADVARLHRDLRKNKSKNNKGKGVEANRTIQLLTVALNKARKWGHLPKSADNVAADVERYKEKPYDRWLEPHEIPPVVEAIDKEKNPYVRAAIMATMYCGLRKKETLSLLWTDVDRTRGTIYVRARKTDDARTVPLAPEARTILDALPRIVGNPHVLAGQGDGRPVSVSTINRAWGRVRKAAGVEDVTFHGLRHTCGAMLARANVSLLKIGKILGHRDPRATMRYAPYSPASGVRSWKASRPRSRR